jgi:hypothetical protein
LLVSAWKQESKSAFVTLQDITHPDTTAAKATTPSPAAQALPAGYLLRAPDWQSLNQQDWVFCRTAVL